jgi:biopolymer transport protein ExbD
VNSDRKPLASINVTPLVDVLLILLVVMMLAMPMFVKKLPVDLPQTAIDGAPTVVHSLSVSLLPDGGLMVGNNPMTIAALKARINPTVSVELNVDRSITYDKVAGLIADIQDSKPKDIALMTR